ncbi:carbohydrate ABC transporter permease [Clostridium sp. Marseille-P2415]|uniref:carbohydrate ABC transporter permease n=1 Tax=Clostridium sp. Marseille-P2415 TaxID=1805471 RepID=UPI000988485F|nr:carbohydrate ABC transporter permease [Clostridium sp. Marseille-P2415]
MGKENQTVRKSNHIHSKNRTDRMFSVIIVLFSIFIVMIIAYPLWFVIIASVSNSDLVNLGAVTWYPKDIRFYGYEQIMEDARIWKGYLNTVIYVLIGTALNIAVTMLAAYALSRKEFKIRNKIMFYFVFTMFFNGGLVPLYMTVNALHLIGSRIILIIMVLVNTYNLIIARTFIENSIPNDLYEAAVLDGCSHFKYFINVVISLSKAVIAVLILYYAVFHWNDYFNALIFNNKSDYDPLQIVLRRILLLNEAFASGNGGVMGGYAQSSADQVKYAVIIVSTVPILCVYPFIQKYFEKGVMIGAIKG